MTAGRRAAIDDEVVGRTRRAARRRRSTTARARTISLIERIGAPWTAGWLPAACQHLLVVRGALPPRLASGPQPRARDQRLARVADSGGSAVRAATSTSQLRISTWLRSSHQHGDAARRRRSSRGGGAPRELAGVGPREQLINADKRPLAIPLSGVRAALSRQIARRPTCAKFPRMNNFSLSRRDVPRGGWCGAVRRVGGVRPVEEDSRRDRAVLGARRAPEGHAGHRPRGGQDGISGRRVLLALLRLDDRTGEGCPQAPRRSRHQVPVDAQQPSGDLGRRHRQGCRAQPDHRQQVHHRRQRRQDLRRRRLEGIRRPAGDGRREAAREQAWRPASTIIRSSGNRSRAASGRWTSSRRTRRKTSRCSSTPAPRSRSESMPSPGSRPTPAGSRASTSRTGARPARYKVAFGEGDVPWKAAVRGGGVSRRRRVYLIEQEHAGPDGELAMAQRCLDNYKKMVK